MVCVALGADDEGLGQGSFPLRLDRPDVQEQRHPLPSAALRSRESVFGHGRFVQTLDQQAGVMERVGVRMKGPVCTDEGHLELVASHVVLVERLFEVRTTNNEWASFVGSFEAAARTQSLDNRKAEPTARLEDARNLANGFAQGVNVLERHECDDTVERRIWKGQRRRVS